MNSYAELLASMMDAALTSDAGKATGLWREKDGFPVDQQLAVYSDGYLIRLVSVVAQAYPALQHCMGKSAFNACAEAFVRAHPSRSYNLDRYPLTFAAFIAAHSQDPIAKELAALEQAIAEVYMADDSPAIDPSWAATQTTETLAVCAFQLRTASRLLACEYTVNDYVNALRAGEKLSCPLRTPNWLFVYRHGNLVQRIPLSTGEYTLLGLFDGTITLANALENNNFAPYCEKALMNGEFMQWFSRWNKKGYLQPLCQTKS